MNIQKIISYIVSFFILLIGIFLIFRPLYILGPSGDGLANLSAAIAGLIFVIVGIVFLGLSIIQQNTLNASSVSQKSINPVVLLACAVILFLLVFYNVLGTLALIIKISIYLLSGILVAFGLGSLISRYVGSKS